MKTIKKSLMQEAEKLSSEWNNTGFVVLNSNGSLEATVWNHYKWESEDGNTPRPVVATVNGNNGWEIDEKFKLTYELV